MINALLMIVKNVKKEEDLSMQGFANLNAKTQINYVVMEMETAYLVFVCGHQ